MSANINSEPKLGIFSLTTLLVSAQYGLGFLLGTAEQAIYEGIKGSLYALSIGLGFVALLALVKFYWQQVEPIWTLLGNRYGRSVKVGVGLMSWMSLIGIEAVQIIAGSTILTVAGVPKLTSMLMFALLFCLLSLLPLEKVSWILRGLLLLNVLVLVYSLWALDGLSIVARSPIDLITSLPQIDPKDGIGIFCCTILLVTIDMKCHQYLVRAKNVRVALWSCIFTAAILIALALLAVATAIAGQQAGIIPPNLDGKEVIPYILVSIGGGKNFWGIVAIVTLAVPALGLGSSVLRIQTRTFCDLEILTSRFGQRILITAINILLALLVAFREGEIVSLMLLFYTAYLAAVLIPLIAYLLDYFDVYTFSTNSVKLSLFMGSISAATSLWTILILPEAIILGSDRLTIIIFGIGLAIIGLVINELGEKLSLAPAIEKETGS